MTREAEAILTAALDLSDDERSEVAKGLLISLGPPRHAELDGGFWTQEIKRRARAMDADPVRGVDVEVALREVEESLGLD